MSGKSIIVSAPSGAGKTTIVKHLLARIPELAFSVSATSRPARPTEVDGIDYFFLTSQEFKNLIDSGEFLEWEEVYPGRHYGTKRSEIDRLWGEGKTVIFDIDVVGGNNLKGYFAEKALAIFVQAPSIEVLESRLMKRSTESSESLKERLDKARYEMTFAKRFDIVIVNDQLEKACAEAEKHVRAFILQ